MSPHDWLLKLTPGIHKRHVESPCRSMKLCTMLMYFIQTML